ncbi:MAG: LemA family protein [Actinomycetota bacterium]
MKRGSLIAVGVVVVVLILLVAPIVSSYNRLVSRSQAVDAQWAQVENVYQRRADLVPNLVATVQGAANFERSTITEVTNARASVGRVQVNAGDVPADPQAFARFQAAQDALSSALSRLLVVVERYPDLKATQNFRDLQAQLEGTENRIAVERRRFNQVGLEYNTAIKRFPATLLAGMFGFDDKAYFRAQEGAERPPPVQFDFQSPVPTPTRT